MHMPHDCDQQSIRIKKRNQNDQQTFYLQISITTALPLKLGSIAGQFQVNSSIQGKSCHVAQVQKRHSDQKGIFKSKNSSRIDNQQEYRCPAQRQDTRKTFYDLQGRFRAYDGTFATCSQSDEFEILMTDNGSGATVPRIGTSGKSLVSYRLSSSPSKQGTNTFALQTVHLVSSNSGAFDSQFVSLWDSSRASGIRLFSPPLWLPGGRVIDSSIH